MSESVLFQRSLTCTAPAAELLKQLSDWTGCVYLQDQQHPVLAFLPESYCVVQQQKLRFFQQQQHNHYIEYTPAQSLKTWMQFQSQQHAATPPLSFCGGYIGFIDFNYAAQQFVASQTAPQPQLYFGKYHSYLKWQHHHWVFYSQSKDAEQLYQQLLQRFATTARVTTLQLAQPMQPDWQKVQYQRAFDRIQDYIKAGDCYQINLTQRFSSQAQGTLLTAAHALWQLTAAPYAGYLKLGEFELLSCSPELFFQFEADHLLRTKPIKGTMPRYADPVQDQASRQRLQDSAKDQAENLMIVDLLRNDLSVYAEIGSVKTPKLFQIESFNQVHHLVSEIQATLRPEINPLDVLLQGLPGGSITGAPKIRAMQIIEELEIAPRGGYCGTLGYFNEDGTGVWNILIRTVQKYQDQLQVWAGGGITIASECDAEYQECLDKVNAILATLNHYHSGATPP
ncbi:anthranilate synthase component I family protein [Acinetobacter larvae]|uniref:Aminodeoxychorismate synthase component I n=1 Tax=Acinetobacter larvae TaxID=1789224 RepID=A0A1B2LX31_9GAMM|nr:anthranilate synthase component I family protein [Acinetobacter larvae]AOA57333.1 aminodeoxychorismate synthase component I [Acinetobacter larvae]